MIVFQKKFLHPEEKAATPETTESIEVAEDNQPMQES